MIRGGHIDLSVLGAIEVATVGASCGGDREGYRRLRSKGLQLGENPHDLYALETAVYVVSLCDLLLKHQDFTGRPPCLVMNFCPANLDLTSIRLTLV